MPRRTASGDAAASSELSMVAGGAGAASVLAMAGDAWADRAGGTSGALWGLALRTWSSALSDEAEITPDAVARGACAGLDAVMRLGRAKVGDKTLVDSFDPFVSTLKSAVGKGQPLAVAWNEAARAAVENSSLEFPWRTG